MSAANIGSKRFHQNNTVSWQISIPRSNSKSSTFLVLSEKASVHLDHKPNDLATDILLELVRSDIINVYMDKNIGYLLSDSGRLLRRIFDQRVRSLNLTAVQARLLLSLFKFPDNNQAFYADRIEVEPITLTRIVDRLEEAGWVERVADPQDRRARILHLTDKSREIVEPLRAIVDGLVADMARGFSAAEADALATLLGKVSANLTAEQESGEMVNG